jgi:hypothetical protein
LIDNVAPGYRVHTVSLFFTALAIVARGEIVAASELRTAQAAITAEPATRQRLFDQLHARLIEDTPTIGLFNGMRIDVVSNRVAGFETFPLKIPRLWDVTVRN